MAVTFLCNMMVAPLAGIGSVITEPAFTDSANQAPGAAGMAISAKDQVTLLNLTYPPGSMVPLKPHSPDTACMLPIFSH